MPNRLLKILLIVVLVSCQTSCILGALTHDEPERPVPTEGLSSVGELPFKEAWYGMYFREDKIGYSHFKVEPSGENFALEVDSLIRLTAMKKTTEESLKERVLVRPDLTLVSFESRVSRNGQIMKKTGKIEADQLVVNISVDDEKLSRKYPVEGKLYHFSAVSFMPALKGLKEGQRNSFKIFNPEKLGFEKIDQEVSTVKGGSGPGGAVWKVKNQYGRSEVVSWLNRKGLTVIEKSLDGSMLTMLEDETAAKKFLEKGAQAKDLVLDLSLIKVSTTFSEPEKLRFLRVRIRGIDPALLATDHRQEVALPDGRSSTDGFHVTVRVEDPLMVSKAASASLAPVSKEFLASTLTIQADNREIVDQAKKIVSPTDSNLRKVVKLVNWTAANVKNEMRDSFTALAVLRSKEGECQAHANLYTALARASGVPTRVVTGLVYTKQLGFLYHAWAESLVGGWLAVDPTLRQIPPDATHIKISMEDSDDISGSLHKMIGNVKMEVLEYE